MRGLDPIAIIDSAYRKAPDMTAWWEGVAESLRPALDRGLGMYAYVLPLGTMRPRDIVQLGAPRALIDYTRAGAERPENRAAVLGVDPAGLYASTEVFPELTWPDGVADGLALSAPDGEGALHVIVSASPRRERTDPDARVLWKRLALHLGAGIRLQRQGGTLDDPEVEAVVSPDGRLLHADAQHTDAETRETLRTLAMRIDALRARRGASGEPDETLDVWQGLLLGRWSMVDHFDTDGRRFLIARRNDPDSPAPRALTRRQRQVVFYASLGLPHKQIGYALGLAETTVATHLRLALDKLGLDSREDLIRVVAQVLGADRAG